MSSESGGVQSLNRALDLVEIVAANGGDMSIGDIGVASGMALSTTHRLLKTLVARGYMRQLPNRHYALGFRLLPLGAAVNASVGADAGPSLTRLVTELGESANLAMLVGDQAEYVAQVPSRHSMRMFTEVGRRVDLHCTGVGKAMLAQLSDDEVAAVVRQRTLSPRTPHTITSEGALRNELALIRAQGYAIDEQEQELGVRCVAVVVAGGLASPMAMSVSGPTTRMTDDFVSRAVPLLMIVAAEFGNEIARRARLD